ncbi:MAG: zinc dependent phospholipase C family protein [Eggerthellales bacterium]|nr:zinc dependent phospholipase C family protein [Eggerthellales bacterium]
MPAIITHDLFGQAAYERLHESIGESQEERFAFLLGNQGPDPLFYARANPTISGFARFGSTMHSTNTNELLAAFHDAMETLAPEEKGIGRAYLLGFLCHYLLDSTVHPLVYANQYALCDAGIDGLSREDGSEVHAVIESEYDEVMLYTRTGKTIANFDTHKEILRASDETLTTIGKLYSYMAVMAFQRSMQIDVFRKSVKAFRLVQNVFYSRTGVKRALIARVEELVRTYSFYRSMSHRAIEATECAFDNHEGNTWTNPFTGAVATTSLYDLFDQAQARVEDTFAIFEDPDFNEEMAAQITGGLNFSGNPRKGEKTA